jgi:hypothetical protein
MPDFSGAAKVGKKNEEAEEPLEAKLFKQLSPLIDENKFGLEILGKSVSWGVLFQGTGQVTQGYMLIVTARGHILGPPGYMTNMTLIQGHLPELLEGEAKNVVMSCLTALRDTKARQLGMNHKLPGT